MTRYLAIILILQVALAPIAGQAKVGTVPDQSRRANYLLELVLESVSGRYEGILKKIPRELVNGLKTQRKARLEQAVGERLQALKEGTMTPNALREEVVRLNQENLKAQKEELFYQIHNLPAEAMDAIASRIENHPSYVDGLQEYRAAYTRTEKANALAKAVSQDLDHHFSMIGKRSNFMTKEGWVMDLERLRATHKVKRIDKDEWLTIIGLAALGIATVGLMTWGIAAGVYGGKYNARKTELDNQYESLRRQLEQHYNQYSRLLSDEEARYLQDNGFVKTICGRYELPDSIICNRYDYALFQGTRYCTVECFKSLADGRETFHSAPSCSAPFIPADCYDPSEYEQGYEDGYGPGYDEGVPDGEEQGDEDGTRVGYDDGFEDGEDEGYNDGYSDGFDDGYQSYTGVMMKPLWTSRTGSSRSLYDRGYQDGKRDAQILMGGGILK